MNKCVCKNKNNDNLCSDKIKCNTVYFFLNLKYDILRQKSTIVEIQNSLINHNNQVNNMLNTHIINNNNMINNINSYINCICSHIKTDDYIMSGIENCMMEIKYCNLCEINITK
jgi:hypothetical protein